MDKDIKILILYAKYGEGHLQVSRVLQKQFAANGIKNVRLEDLFADAHPVIDRMARFIYEQSFSVASFLYGWSYYLTKNMENDNALSRHFNAFGIRKLQELIKTDQPDIVINTFPMLVMPELKARTGADIPVFSILTDFDLHGRWLHSKIDKYYVATEDLKAKIMNKGIPSQKVLASGIPIQQDFEHPRDAAAVQSKYGLDPSKKTILLMAASYGGPREVGSACQFLANDERLQMIVVCGKNKRLQQKMTDRFKHEPTLRILGFTEDIPRLMEISSCIVTKPGGITLSEALRCQLPIFLCRPVPGQEKENARCLTEKGAAHIVDNKKNLAADLRKFLFDDQKLEEMKQAAHSLQKPKAAENIVQDMLKETDRMKQRTERAHLF
ncbi:MAG TPA: glycosyltransferase [Bacillales bacterium]|nr:glycosyltransferase [Bacillales bacterium]